MSDEEKKAIEYIKNCLDNEYDFKNATRQKDKKAYNIILNLIEKQSKEIEELKEVKWYYEISRVPKDKIKAKIEELKQKKYILSSRESEIEILKSLLEKE